MFSCSRLKLFIIICYWKKYFFKKNKSLLYSLKSIQKYYLEDNSGDFYALLTFYELCRS